ncbi:glycosyltransferase [Cereibacter sphaeroides]|uniref:glycosyltransferase family 2 protein n=1 Tax=Cereibacter sphaeroides TaxID=1063 RepID=UPI001F1BE283|nr:glycosyltransferase [Cereibacter sphaeroides]MCE6952212.1 glycosyltransferase [Cereibacter sphaeroides]
MKASLIVVSRGRSDLLARAVTAIRQQDHPCLELVVVADAAGLAALPDLPIKRVAFDAPNISAARNAGIARSAGEVVAFLDDDAVPEPTWLSRLVAPFEDARVVASGGFVRGRNGITFQWRASAVDRCGIDHPLAVDPQGVTLCAPRGDLVPRVQGTCAAFRRKSLVSVGGFDPAFRFYLDETDLCRRLGPAGLTAIVPLAQVHHGFAAGPHRRADRVPASLFEIGASSLVFLRRHAAVSDWPEAVAALRTSQRLRLVRHMVAGRLEPGDVRRLMRTLDAGLEEGRSRPLAPLPPLPDTGPPFLHFPGTGPRPGRVLGGSPVLRRKLLAEARKAVAEGCVVTLFLLDATARPHRHAFHPDGFWLQSGGLFGPSLRDGLRLRLRSRRQRIAEEQLRLSETRPINYCGNGSNCGNFPDRHQIADTSPLYGAARSNSV